MAMHLLKSSHKTFAFGSKVGSETQRMRKDLQLRFSAVVLAFITLTAVIFAGINFWKERQYPVPYDGAWWVESGDGLKAERLSQDGQAEKAGIKSGDRLVAINDQPI